MITNLTNGLALLWQHNLKNFEIAGLFGLKRIQIESFAHLVQEDNQDPMTPASIQKLMKQCGLKAKKNTCVDEVNLLIVVRK